MAKVLDGGQAVPLEEVVLAQAFQLEALMNVLERKGVLQKAEVLEATKALQAKPRHTRATHSLVQRGRWDQTRC